MAEFLFVAEATGIWSGNCSNRASTTATTSVSTNGSRAATAEGHRADQTHCLGRRRLPGAAGAVHRRITTSPRLPRPSADAPGRGRGGGGLTVPARAAARGPDRGAGCACRSFSARRPDEPVDADLRGLLRRLVRRPAITPFQRAVRLCERSGLPTRHQSAHLAWCWRAETAFPDRRKPVQRPAQARVRVPWDDLRAGHGSWSTRCRVSASSAAATKCATLGSTSHWSLVRSLPAPGRPPRVQGRRQPGDSFGSSLAAVSHRAPPAERGLQHVDEDGESWRA